MNMFKNSFFILLLILGFSTFFSTHTFANTVDIFLTEAQEKKEITVFADSNGEYIPGVDMSLVFSDNVFIQSISNGDYCDLFFSVSIKENNISLECFNDLDLNLDGPLLFIEYVSDSDDYFFYLSERYIDFGGPTLGRVENINKPDFIENESDENNIQETWDFYGEYGTVDAIIDFLRINSFYILGGVVFLVLIVFAVFVFDIKTEKDYKEEL